MKCPHCDVGIHYFPHETLIAANATGNIGWIVENSDCPECKNTILVLKMGAIGPGPRRGGPGISNPSIYRLIEPPVATRPVSPDVPSEIAGEYRQAAAILDLSPMASAAVSRRCLQNVIRTALHIKKGSLEKEIDEVISDHRVSTGLGKQLDAVRHIGNFAAHPIKNTSTGVILEVEPGEAEWNLDVLDGIFEELYVQPAHIAARTAALNEKLDSAGKPTI
jgi:hypothetical protein